MARLEKLFEEAGYRIRYETGTFRTDHCVVAHRKLVIVNKFLTPEARFASLREVWEKLELTNRALHNEGLALFAQPQEHE